MSRSSRAVDSRAPGEERIRTSVVAGAGLLSALVAGYVLTGAGFPGGSVGITGAFAGSDGAWEQLSRLAPGVGLLVAIGVCGLLTVAAERMDGADRTGGADRPAARGLVGTPPPRAVAWLVALLGIVGLLVLVPASGQAAGAAEEAAARFGLAVAAGVLLGAAARAAEGTRWALPLVAAGAATVAVVAQAASVTWAVRSLAGGAAAFAADEGGYGSWWWPIALAALFVVAALTLDSRSGAGTDRTRDGKPAAPSRPPGAGGDVVRGAGSGIALILFVVVGYVAFALADSADGWVLMAAGLAVSVVLVGACGAVLGGAGTVLPAALAVGVVAGPVTAETASTMILAAPVVIAIIVLGCAAGAAGVRWPSRAMGYALLLLAAVLGVVSFGDPQALLVFRMLVTAVGGAYALTSCLVAPGTGVGGVGGSSGGARADAQHAVLAAGAVFVTTAAAALTARVVEQTHGPAVRVLGTLGDGGPASASVGVGVGVAMTLTVVGCAAVHAAIPALRALSTRIPPDASGRG